MSHELRYIGIALAVLVSWIVLQIGFGYVWHKHHERARRMFRTPNDETPA